VLAERSAIGLEALDPPAHRRGEPRRATRLERADGIRGVARADILVDDDELVREVIAPRVKERLRRQAREKLDRVVGHHRDDPLE
jgi:hypothetical protein